MPTTSKASTFTIRELSGDGRTLVLAERALPYRPITFSGTMRAEFTWYPGNPEATVQVLGAAEDETTIRGQWKNKFLGEQIEAEEAELNGKASQPSAIAQLDGIDVTSAMALCKAVDDFRRKGQLVEVTWDEIIRHGILTKFVQTFDRRQDVEWEISFQWISQGEPTVPAVTSRESDMSDVLTSWSKTVNQLDQAHNASPFAQLQGFASSLNTAVSNIENAISEITDTISAGVSSVLSPLNTVKRLVGIMETIQDNAASIVNTITHAVDLDNFDLGLQSIDQATFGQDLQAKVYDRALVDSARQAQRQAARQQQDLAKRIDPDLVAVFVARANLDLRDVSTRYYGTPDEWRRLQLFGDFPSSALSAGDVVFVPQAQTGDAP